MSNNQRSIAIKQALAAAVSNARDTSISAVADRLEGASDVAPEYTTMMFPFTRSTYKKAT